MTEDRGFTLVEMLVAMVLFMVLFGAIVLISTTYMHDNTYDGYRDNAQDAARQVIDRVSRDLRDAASTATNAAPSTGGLLERATSSDIVFEEVSATGSSSSSDLPNEMQVRYCLDSSETLWRQTTTPGSAYTTLPDTSACPSMSSTWTTASVVLGKNTLQHGTNTPVYVTNTTSDPVFTYLLSTGASTTSPTTTQLRQIKQVDVSLYINQNPGSSPVFTGTQITSAVYLRNDTTLPIAAFTATFGAVSGSTTTRYVLLNGSGSSDPNGQAVTYQWYLGGSCTSSSAESGGSAISGATSQSYDSAPTAYTIGTAQTFTLVVTDTAGLTGCSSSSVTPS